MRYRRRSQQFEQEEESFSRRFKYEAIKENIGKLLEYGGAGVGALVGFAAAKLGLPLPPETASIVGGAIGGATGATGKAYAVTAIDSIMRRRGPKPGPTESSTHPVVVPPKASTAGVHTFTASIPNRMPRSTRHAGPSGLSAVASAIADIASQLQRMESDLYAIADQMMYSQQTLTLSLHGTRGEMLTRPPLIQARAGLNDCAKMLQQARTNLGSYLRVINP